MVLSRMRIALGAVVGVTLALVGAAWSQAPQDEPQAAEPDGAAPDALAVALPGPNQFVSGLDLECFDTPGPALNINVQLSHLNPVLQGLGLPTHVATIRELQQTCVPVQKNGVPPQPAALPFIQNVDLACYRIDTGPINPVTLTLKHLNPVFANFPSHNVVLTQAVQLCLPVAKNNVIPTPDILRLIQFIDPQSVVINTIHEPQPPPPPTVVSGENPLRGGPIPDVLGPDDNKGDNADDIGFLKAQVAALPGL